MALSYYTTSSANDLHKFSNEKKMPNVCFTLPITCQICLGKVKEPVVCSNLHTFCSVCIDIWLEKSKHCPTCRVPINKENPCRKILGGSDSNEELLMPTDFSHASTRKARFHALFQQYEDEFSRLLRQIDSLNNEIAELKDPTRFNVQASSTSPQKDIIQLLKIKLEQLQANYEEMNKDREKLRESNKKLESENSILFQEIQRLKVQINETKSQMTSRYTVAALETKLETYEKEIKQLQKALEKSDNYIQELESTFIKKKSPPKAESAPIKSPPPIQSVLKTDVKLEDIKLVKPEKTEQKTVKFVEPNEQLSAKKNRSNSISSNGASKVELIPNGSRMIQIPGKVPSISNDKFYGSPKKSQSQHTSSVPAHQIMSFGERLKKNLSFDLEAPSPLSQSLNNSTFNCTATTANEASSSSAASSSTTHEDPPTATTKPTVTQHDYLFSPMKRLRLEETTQLEKPDVSMLSQTAEQPTKRHETPQLNMSVCTPEFNDCLQLLNEAETKVQNRTSPKHQQFTLTPNKTNSELAMAAAASLKSPRFESTNNFMAKMNRELHTDDFYNNARSRSVEPGSKN